MSPAPSVDLGALLPSLIVFGAGVLVLLLGPLKDAFKVIVPALIAVGLVLVIAQPRLNAWLAARR